MKTRAMTSALAVAAKASTKRKALSSPAAEYQIAYLQLRSRTLVMTTMAPRISRSRVKNSIRGEISRCESNASCDVGGDSESAACCSSFGRESFRRETTPSSHYRRDESYDLESMVERRSPMRSTVERRSPMRSTVVMNPSDAEMEEFFAAAERKETQRFAAKYNYDVVNDVPLDNGRYEWIQIAAP